MRIIISFMLLHTVIMSMYTMKRAGGAASPLHMSTMRNELFKGNEAIAWRGKELRKSLIEANLFGWLTAQQSSADLINDYEDALDALAITRDVDQIIRIISRNIKFMMKTSEHEQFQGDYNLLQAIQRNLEKIRTIVGYFNLFTAYQLEELSTHEQKIKTALLHHKYCVVLKNSIEATGFMGHIINGTFEENLVELYEKGRISLEKHYDIKPLEKFFDRAFIQLIDDIDVACNNKYFRIVKKLLNILKEIEPIMDDYSLISDNDLLLIPGYIEDIEKWVETQEK